MNGRVRYFVNRLLLVSITYMGIMVVTFLFTQMVPGGPIDQLIAESRAATAEGGSSVEAYSIPPEVLKAYREELHFDKPIIQRFWIWLVHDRFGMKAESIKFKEPAWDLISSHFPVSLSFGIPSLLLTYTICIPLGIAKALKNGKPFDLFSSVFVFVLYAIPTFAFGMVLKMLFSGTVDWAWDIFPLGGFRSPNWDELSTFEKIMDQAWHMFLPLTCYVIGSFAVMTLLMKNSLLEQISQDYVRTVLAKGSTLNHAIWKHALRNALIPMATGIGGILSIMFAGSVLIEKVFNIQGIGLLSLDAAVTRDFPLFLGIVSIQAILGLLGRVLSDFCYVLIDPRIHFGGNR